jgi:hypothetical protein
MKEKCGELCYFKLEEIHVENATQEFAIDEKCSFENDAGNMTDFYCSARRLSRIIESAAYCDQILLAKVYINRAQSTSVN